MLRFLIRRTLFGVLVLWLISVAVFVLFFVAPHDPARAIAGRQATAQTVELVRHRLGLDQPVLTQYWHFLARLTRGRNPYGR
jgi:peptide/nickel transport system permease protein